jgi:hypothetical protein
MCYQVPILALISFVSVLFYQRTNPTWFRINRIFNGRIEIATTYLRTYGLTLLPKSWKIFWEMSATTIDNSYMYLLICCGLIVGIGYYVLATKAQLRLYRQRKTIEILFFTVFALYAMLEQGPFNPILNPFVLVIGNLIYREQGECSI